MHTRDLQAAWQLCTRNGDALHGNWESSGSLYVAMCVPDTADCMGKDLFNAVLVTVIQMCRHVQRRSCHGDPLAAFAQSLSCW